MTIEQIKNELREMIALGDAATAGPWEVRRSDIYQSGGRHIAYAGPSHTPKSQYPKSCKIMDSDNATFIARSRTMTPLACKGLLLAIEDLEGRANSYRGDASQMSAIKRVEEIRQLWEDSK
jgi:hypothetical protein